MEQVGYQLIQLSDNSIVGDWGGVYGQCPGVPNPLVLPNGDHVCAASVDVEYGGYKLVAWMMDRPPQTVIDGVVFLARVTDEEYAAVLGAASQNVQIARWIDTFRLLGTIDVASATAQAAKSGLVAANLLTQDRADAIFATA